METISLSNRMMRNERARKRYLIQQLKSGRVPHPRKAAPWLLELYKRYGVENKVFIPMQHLTPEQTKQARNKARYERTFRWI
jgi:hypothetical protein